MTFSPEGELVHLEDCDITVHSVLCCGVMLWWAKLPDCSICCDTASHGSREVAIDCARKRIAKGIAYEPAESLIEPG